MKTLQERASDWADRLSVPREPASYRKVYEANLINMMKEQEQLTRHKIADAIMEHGGNGSYTYQDTTHLFILTSEAHKIVLDG